MNIMLLDNVLSVSLILFGVLYALFAKKIFDFFIKSPGASDFRDKSPSWMLAISVWLMRGGGVVAVILGIRFLFE